MRLRRLLNHKPTRFSPAPYCLDLTVGSVLHQQYGIGEQRAREAATRFPLLASTMVQAVKGSIFTPFEILLLD